MPDGQSGVGSAERHSARDSRFDQYVDEFHAGLEICGQLVSPSDALATDPVAYREAHITWLRESEEALKAHVVENFPHPVAHYLRRFLKGSRTQRDKLNALRDSWEALIQTLFAMTLGELRVRNHPTEHCDVDRRWISSQTIFDRIELIARVYAWGGRNLQIAGRLTEMCLAGLKDLNQSRNSLAHRAAGTEAQARRELEALAPMFLRILRQVTWLAEWQIVRPTGAMEDGRSELQLFQGYSAEDHYIFATLSQAQRIAIATRPNSQCELFALKDELLLCLSPIFHLMPASESLHTHIGFLKKQSRNALVYEVVGQSKDQRIEDQFLMSSLNELKGLFAKGKRGSE